MATYKKEHLQEMIREVVRKELKEQVSAVISEVLAEKFLKQLAESAVNMRPRGVNNLSIQGSDEIEDEEAPSILDNNILAPGQPNPRFDKHPAKRGVKQFSEDKERNEMLNLFFEGTRPINAAADDEIGPGEIPIDVEKPEVRELTETWKALATGMEKAAASKKPVVNPLAEEDRLRRLRESLDVPAATR